MLHEGRGRLNQRFPHGQHPRPQQGVLRRDIARHLLRETLFCELRGPTLESSRLTSVVSRDWGHTPSISKQSPPPSACSPPGNHDFSKTCKEVHLRYLQGSARQHCALRRHHSTHLGVTQMSRRVNRYRTCLYTSFRQNGKPRLLVQLRRVSRNRSGRQASRAPSERVTPHPAYEKRGDGEGS